MAVVAQPEAVYRLNSKATGSRPREVSITSTTSQTSLASSASDSSLRVRPKRQQDFEKYFATRIREISPESDLEVVATQSCDWQSNVLLYGRLYLTRQYLCFRSNILGYVTEQIHPLKNVVSLERGTTAKWIQNAVYVSVKEGEDPEGTHYGYGSLKDRNAMHDAVLEAWRGEAPEAVKEMEKGASLESPLESPRESEGTGEHYAELAIDICFPILLKDLFDLLYHNDDFMMDFLQNDKKLTDIKISKWEGDPQTRTLSYVMHMTGMGPSESDCYGSETVAVADESTSYEIASETRTPGVPSGRKFVIRTRTCLTHTEMDGKPAARMHCTTECDWESSSWLKSTITPAVIKGQREHHKQLAKKVSQWIQDHGGDQSVVVDAVPVAGASTALKQKPRETSGNSTALSQLEDMWSHASQITTNPVMIGIIAVLLAIILLK